MKKSLLEQYVHEFLEDYSLEKGLLPSTVENKRVSMELFMRFVGDRDVTVPLIREYLSILRQRRMTASVRNEIKNLRALGNFLVKRRYITPEDNWADQITMPRLIKEPLRVPDVQTMERIIIAGTEPGKNENRRCRLSKIEQRLALQFAVRTGVRSEELRTLPPTRFYLDQAQPTFSVEGKGKKVRYIPVPPDMIEVIKERCREPRKYVFSVSERVLNDALVRGAKALGVVEHVHAHSLRHSFASELLRLGMPIEVVGKILGHANVQLTYSTYAHLIPNDFAVHMARLPIVQARLSPSTIFDTVIQAVKSTGVLKDAKFSHEIKREGNQLIIIIQTA